MLEEQKPSKILQGLRVAQAAVTERWPEKAEKTSEKSPFFLKKIKFTKKKYFCLVNFIILRKKTDFFGFFRPAFGHGRLGHL